MLLISSGWRSSAEHISTIASIAEWLYLLASHRLTLCSHVRLAQVRLSVLAGVQEEHLMAVRHKPLDASQYHSAYPIS